jgi:hypothetical protein
MPVKIAGHFAGLVQVPKFELEVDIWGALVEGRSSLEKA